jgi:hypothetical protein
MTNTQYYAFGVDRIRLTQISHLLKVLGIPTIPHVFSDSQSPIASIKNWIYGRTPVAHIATKYHLAADMARDGEIDLSYVPTAEILADWFAKPLPKPAFLKHCSVMGMIGIGVGNGVGNGLGIGIVNGRGNGHRNGIRTWACTGNAIRK